MMVIIVVIAITGGGLIGRRVIIQVRSVESWMYLLGVMITINLVFVERIFLKKKKTNQSLSVLSVASQPDCKNNEICPNGIWGSIWLISMNNIYYEKDFEIYRFMMIFYFLFIAHSPLLQYENSLWAFLAFLRNFFSYWEFVIYMIFPEPVRLWPARSNNYCRSIDPSAQLERAGFATEKYLAQKKSLCYFPSVRTVITSLLVYSYSNNF